MNSKLLLKSTLLLALSVMSFSYARSQCSVYHNWGAWSYGTITNVTLNTLNNTTGATSSSGYYDLFPTSGSTTTTVYTGMSYNLSVSGSYYNDMAVWIDWNADNTFDASTEYYYMGTNYNYNSTTYTQYITVPSGTSAGNKRMRVRCDAYFYGSIYSSAACNAMYYGETEDYTISVLIPPACSGTPNPGNTLSNPTTVCSNEGFMLSLSNTLNFSGLTYQWQSSANGTSYSNISGATNSIYFGSQTSATYYRCLVTCTSASASATSTALYLEMSPHYECYCSSAATNPYDEEIFNVTIGTASNTTNCSSTGGSGSTNSLYNNYQGLAPYGAVQLEEVEFSLGINTCGGYYSSGSAIFIDYNHNGSFADAGEQVYADPSTTYGPYTVTGTFQIPLTATPGLTGLRVINAEGYYGPYITPCLSYGYGETEDYLINIIPIPNNDAGVGSILDPGIPTCDFDSVDVTIELVNSGVNNLTSCDIKYQVNSGSVVTYNFTGNVAGYGGSTTVVIANLNFNNGDDLTIWTENPNGVQDSLLGNDTATVHLQQGLSGTFAIPGDYATVQESADALAELGVCDDVIFNLATGTYNEQVTFSVIPGVNADATVTYKSATNNADDVTIEYAQSTNTDNWVIKLEGTDWVTFRDITAQTVSTSYYYGNVFVFSSGSDNNTIEECNIIGTDPNYIYYWNTGDYQSNIYMTGRNDANTIQDNFIQYGNSAIYVNGNNSNRSESLLFENNMLKDAFYYTTNFEYINGLEFNHNTITADTMYPWNGTYGLYMYSCDNFNVKGNYIGTDFGYGYAYGMQFENCIGNPSPKSQVVNNCVTVGVENSYSYGYYGVYMYGSGNMDFLHNTITKAGGYSGQWYYTFYASQGGSISVRNNSFVDKASSCAFFIDGGFTLTESDNNNIYSSNPTPIYYLGNYYPTLQAYQNASGLDLHSLEINTQYASILECATCNDTLDGAGMPISYLSDDINQNPRSSSTPDIGAVEYVTPATFTLGEDDTICATNPVVEAGPAQSVGWSINGSTSTDPFVTLTCGPTPTSFDIVVVIQTEYCGSASDSVSLFLVPNAELNPTEHLCADETMTLNPGGGGTATYQWSTNETTSTIDISAAGTYTVLKTELGCESVGTTVVTQSDAVEILDSDVCLDDVPLFLDATITDGTSYAWSGGSSTNTAVNSFNTSGPYSVTATDVFGCTSISNFNVAVLDVPVAGIAQSHSGNVWTFDASTSTFLGANTTYFWDFGYNGLTGTNMIETVYYPFTNPPVTYTVSLSVDNGCGTDDAVMDVKPDAVGIDEIADRSFMVFPNPTKDVVFIKGMQEWSTLKLSVMDNAGRVVLSETHTAGAQLIELNMSELASGSYLVELVTDNSKEVHPLILD